MKSEDILGFIEGADCVDSIADKLDGYFGSLGFDKFAYFTIRPPARLPAPIFVNTYPEDWLSRYVDENYETIDPVFPKAAETVLPIRWDEMWERRAITKRQRRLFDEATDFGITNGMTIPLHGPESGFATLSLCGRLPPADFDHLWSTKRHDLAILAAHTQESLVRLCFENAEIATVKLSERERECLAWASGGKTNWEIAQILGISTETVVTHMKGAMRKLGVYSKHHAVVKAIIHGLISI